MPDPQQALTPDSFMAQQSPNSVLGGAGRRLIDVIKGGVKGSNPLPNEGESWLDSPLLTLGVPAVRMAKGQWGAEKQLAPQLVDQLKQADASHQNDTLLQRMNPLNANLLDARAATTGLSMLDPFASASVGNVNQLQDEGRGSEATGQGLTDAGLLAAGEIAPRVPLKAAMRGAGRAMQNNAAGVAELAAHPVASVVKPVARGAISGGGRLLQRMGAEATPPATPAPEPAGPTARMIDVPSRMVQGSPQPPVNLLDQVRGSSPQPPSEFDVTPTQSYSPQPLSAEPQSGTYMADPRTHAEILEGIQSMRGVGQGKVSTQEFGAANTAPVRPARPGFGTAEIPIEERPDMSQFYGKNAVRSNLAKNQRQMGTTPQPTTPRFIAKPDPTADDLAFQDEHMEDILQAAIGQKRLIDQVRGQ